ncbi:hypothetical protein JXQ70_19620 [bacterium]|nr:hypothetical protein [bacterium]
MTRMNTFLTPYLGLFCIICVCIIQPTGLSAQEQLKEFYKNTWSGCWQKSERLITYPDGTYRLDVFKTSRVEDVEEMGQEYVTIEIERQEYYLNGQSKRKEKGPFILLKSLIPKVLFEEHFITMRLNPVEWASTLILKIGEEDPVLIEKSGLDRINRIFEYIPGTEYTYQKRGRVSVPLGSFTCFLFEALGTASRYDSKNREVSQRVSSTIWVHKTVPFGIIQEETSLLNEGQTVQIQSRLIDYGNKGAFTQFEKRSNKKSPFSSLSNLIWGHQNGEEY